MKKSKNNITESYRRLKNIVESNSSNFKAINITSNSDLEGKTEIAKNFAVILARGGKNTLFVDCSLNSTSKKDGLINMLQILEGTNVNDDELKGFISDTKCGNLSVLALGTNNLDDYSSVFKTDNLKKIIEKLKRSFDYIIIDSPSFNNLSYTEIIAGAADGCLLVLKDGANEVSDGSLIKDKLSRIGCNVLGCVLNRERKPTEIFSERYKNFFKMEQENRKKRDLTNNKVAPSA